MQESESWLSEFIFYSSCSKVAIYRIFLQGIIHGLYLQNNLQVVSPSLQSWILASTQSPPQFSPSHEHHSWETARILHKGDETLAILREINKSRLPGQQDFTNTGSATVSQRMKVCLQLIGWWWTGSRRCAKRRAEIQEELKLKTVMNTNGSLE